MTESIKLFGLCEEELNAYLKAISGQNTSTAIPQSEQKKSSSHPERIQKKDKPPEYFYDISTNLFI
jgi:hypothetical protein